MEFEKHMNLINTGEFDQELKTTKPSLALGSTCFLIGMEKIQTGVSQTEKALLKKNKKLQTIKDRQMKEQEALAADQSIELEKTQEELEEARDAEIAATAQRLHLAIASVEQFAFFNVNYLLSSVSQVDAIWLRENKEVKKVIQKYGHLLTDEGRFSFGFILNFTVSLLILLFF